MNNTTVNTTTLKPAGYLINHPNGPQGNPGIAYNYIMAGNGIHIQAENDLLSATSPLAPARVAGLPPITPTLILPHGPIPAHLFEKGLSWLKACPTTERYFAIVVKDSAHRLVIPEQIGGAAHLSYRPPDNAVAEFHSHGVLDAFFSTTDDRDEQGLRIYGVIGRTNAQTPQLVLRLGIYGAFREIPWLQAFDQPTNTVALVTRDPS